MDANPNQAPLAPVVSPPAPSSKPRLKKKPKAKLKGAAKKSPAKARPASAKAQSSPKKLAKPAREDAARQVARELSKLRAVLKEVGSAVVDRLDGEAASLALFLDGDRLPGERPILPCAGALKAMAALLATLKVKPKKGRVKDLARIEALLSGLAAKTPPGA